ncbi:KEOPS complex subunit Pcc1 [Candidatus Hecatella orcuttiae]|uniref:KEOPS complex subunit Pcc1 n=1 Tax=Candidatus Hecatella orcuttiae TaxID=1935119 RepID=UPI002867CFE0|nr:KEOPS complex subunit Pcc1 [Candidatus Hecatella orcuttiae]
MAKFKAELRIKMERRRKAEALAKSVKADNLQTPPQLSVKSWFKNKTFFSTVECDKNFETFLATLDDLLSCLQAAEKTLKVL